MQQTERGQNKVDQILTCIQENHDCFSARLREVQAYMESRAEEEGRKMLSDHGIWIAERVFKAQKKLFKASKVTMKQNTAG